ncbi:hypothetical protein CMEL01_14629 [Colletotrichum melonis]|uniref:Uncharacterized protein n=1 Tax=Colletotrichum melonis TaxID=1209925 RepID=A0AAI9UNC0_9PEZI|nr:hypothetical protein CMEL01_14629 [Colletotrichum melonis]
MIRLFLVNIRIRLPIAFKLNSPWRPISLQSRRRNQTTCPTQQPNSSSRSTGTARTTRRFGVTSLSAPFLTSTTTSSGALRFLLFSVTLAVIGDTATTRRGSLSSGRIRTQILAKT